MCRPAASGANRITSTLRSASVAGRIQYAAGSRPPRLLAPLLRALLDAAREGADPDQLVSAARAARERAMLTPEDLAELRPHPPFAGAQL